MAARTITLEELASHGTQQDAWIAIHGKVWDITSYIERHPGGTAPILKYVGKDGTKAFDSVHPYVKPENKLPGLLIGYLEGSEAADIVKGDPSASSTKVGWFSKCCKSKKRGSESKLPTTKLVESRCSPEVVVYDIKFQSNCHESDWSVGIMDKSTLIVHKLLDRSDAWVSKYQLKEPLIDDTIKVRFRKRDRCCQISLKKPKPAIWKSLGTPDPINNTIVDCRSISDFFDACLVYKQKLIPDVYLWGFRLPPSVKFGLHIGFHIRITKDDVTKSYTPICYSMTRNPEPNNLPGGRGQIVWFIFKVYKGGALTPKLDAIPVEKGDKGIPTIKLSAPQGSFDMEWLLDRSVDVMLLFAGGTGLTPMAKIIRFSYDNRRKRGKRQVVLMFWGRTENDLIWKDQFDQLNTKDWFDFVPVITQPGPKWTGHSGRPTEKLINDIISKLSPTIASSTHKQGYICGPSGFTNAVETALKNIIPENSVHIFEG